MITNKLLTETLQEWSDTLSVDGQSGDSIVTKEDLNRLSEKLIVIMHRILARRIQPNCFSKIVKYFHSYLSSKLNRLSILASIKVHLNLYHHSNQQYQRHQRL
jgi:hypothetical protein